MTNKEQTVRIVRTKAYKAIMSTGDPIQLEQEEIEKVLAGANQKALIVVKRGVINPAFLVSITDDKDRVKAWVDEINRGAYIDDAMTRTQGDEARERGMKPLASIFEGKLQEQLRESALEKAKELGIAKPLGLPGGKIST